jgi:hypothetical protein
MGDTSNVTLVTAEPRNDVPLTEVLRLIQTLVVSSTRTQVELAQLRDDQHTQHARSEASRLAHVGQDETHARSIKESLEALHRTILVDISMIQEKADNKIRTNFDDVRDSIGRLNDGLSSVHQNQNDIREEGAKFCEIQQNINETVRGQLTDMHTKVCEERSALSLQSNVSQGSGSSLKRKQSAMSAGNSNDDQLSSGEQSNAEDFIHRKILTASRVLANRMRARNMALPQYSILDERIWTSILEW